MAGSLAFAAHAAIRTRQPYTATKSAPVAYDIDFRVIVTAPAGTKTLKVWVPVPQDDAGQKITAGEWSVFPSGVKPAFHTEKVFGNRFAYFEFASPQGGADHRAHLQGHRLATRLERRPGEGAARREVAGGVRSRIAAPERRS